MGNTITKSYSPTINNRFNKKGNLINTPYVSNLTYDCDDPNTMSLPNNNKKTIKNSNRKKNKKGKSKKSYSIKKNKCLPYTNKRLTSYLLKILYKQKKINPNKVIAPKQISANCWFNCFFMCFFISDKGVKFFKTFRESCITGIIPNSNIKMNKGLHKPLWILNNHINASIYGNDFATLMNTNKIIKGIYDFMKKHKIKIFSTRSGGDPIYFFLTILKYLYEHDKNKIPYIIELYNHNYFFRLLKYGLNHKIHTICLQYPHNDKAQYLHKPLYFDIYSNIENKYIRYALDSLVLSSLDKQHYMCCITINNKDYCFDGEGFTTLYKQSWKNKLNKNNKFKSNKGKVGPWIKNARKTLNFNYAVSHQILIYYRITK